MAGMCDRMDFRRMEAVYHYTERFSIARIPLAQMASIIQHKGSGIAPSVDGFQPG